MQIDLTGAQGNAYALLAQATNAARLLRFGAAKTQDILARMCAGTYEEMLDVLDDEFPGVFHFIGDPRPDAKTLAPRVLRSMKAWGEGSC